MPELLFARSSDKWEGCKASKLSVPVCSRQTLTGDAEGLYDALGLSNFKTRHDFESAESRNGDVAGKEDKTCL
jgi:hypothetical protein